MARLKSHPLETSASLMVDNDIWQELPVKNYAGRFSCERPVDGSPTAQSGQLSVVIIKLSMKSSFFTFSSLMTMLFLSVHVGLKDMKHFHNSHLNCI